MEPSRQTVRCDLGTVARGSFGTFGGYNRVPLEGERNEKGNTGVVATANARCRWRTRRPKKSGASLVDRKSKEPFAIAIFNGPVGKNSVPAYFAEGWDLGDGGLFVGEGGVIAGPFESDNCVILRPRGKKYVIK